MSPELAATILLGVVIIVFIWNLHCDIMRLRARVARLDRLFLGFMRRQPEGSPAESSA